jgi:hypothetical protein
MLFAVCLKRRKTDEIPFWTTILRVSATEKNTRKNYSWQEKGDLIWPEALTVIIFFK